MCASVKFGFPVFASVVLFLDNIFYYVYCNLLINKEIHKVVKYLGVGFRVFNILNMVKEHIL
jgi:hypothetical protein